MNLAATFGLYLLSLASVFPPAQQIDGQAPASTPSAQDPQRTQSAPSPAAKTPASPDHAKPTAASPAKPRHHKKATPNCSNAPAAPADPTKPASTAPANAATSTLPPCPPPKKVVHNGGSEEPSVQLTGGTTAGQAAHQPSTDQLTAATEENLKKIEGLQLSPSQQELKDQITRFMDQSKAAIAAGDLERGHNLAMKAHLLSDELVKP